MFSLEHNVLIEKVCLLNFLEVRIDFKIDLKISISNTKLIALTEIKLIEIYIKKKITTADSQP